MIETIIKRSRLIILLVACIWLLESRSHSGTNESKINMYCTLHKTACQTGEVIVHDPINVANAVRPCRYSHHQTGIALNRANPQSRSVHSVELNWSVLTDGVTIITAENTLSIQHSKCGGRGILAQNSYVFSLREALSGDLKNWSEWS